MEATHHAHCCSGDKEALAGALEYCEFETKSIGMKVVDRSNSKNTNLIVRRVALEDGKTTAKEASQRGTQPQDHDWLITPADGFADANGVKHLRLVHDSPESDRGLLPPVLPQVLHPLDAAIALKQPFADLRPAKTHAASQVLSSETSSNGWQLGSAQHVRSSVTARELLQREAKQSNRSNKQPHIPYEDFA